MSNEFLFEANENNEASVVTSTATAGKRKVRSNGRTANSGVGGREFFRTFSLSGVRGPLRADSLRADALRLIILAPLIMAASATVDWLQGSSSFPRRLQPYAVPDWRPDD